MHVKLSRLLSAVSAGALAISSVAGTQAADLTARPPAPLPYVAPAQPYSFVSEVRIGGHAQDPGSAEKDTYAVNGEVLFARPQIFQDPFWQALVPRPTAGGSYNTDGRTSYAYLGATWTVDLFPETLNRTVFLEGFFGAAAHNGHTGEKTLENITLNALGCTPIFREAAALGFRLTEHWSIMATVDHISNAGLCVNNRGLTNFGGKIGYTF